MVEYPDLMMGKFNRIWFSLNGRILICLVISISGMGAVTVFSFFASWSAANSEAYRVFDIIENETVSRIEDSLRGYRKTARQAGYSITVQRYLLSENPETVIQSYTAAMENIYSAYSDNIRECDNICLISRNGRYLAMNRGYIDELRDLAERTGFSGITDPFLVMYRTETGENLLLFFFPLSNILWVDPSGRILCVIICNFSGVTEIPAGLEGGTPGAAILHYEDTIISTSRSLSAGELEVLERIPQGRGHVTIGGRRYLTVRAAPHEGRWGLSYLISERQILSQVFSRLNNGLLPLAAVIILTVIILILVIRSVNAGISRIVTDLNKLEYSQGLKYRIDGPHLREIELISHSVGRLLERLGGSFRREQEANRRMMEAVSARARAEFAGYRAQINPHFLFNTLECVRSMAHKQNDEDMEALVSSLASMFRYSLFALPMVPLAQELDHVANYIKVMNIVRGSATPPRYRLEIRAGKEARNFPVPSMILQPIAENSIFHGFSNRESGDNVISIRARRGRQAGNLSIRIEDNGEGMTEAELAMLNRRIGASGENETDIEGRNALCNIHRRMSYYFKDEFSMVVESKKNSYARVKIVIPRDPQGKYSCTG
jgi:two-component system sensor histidine kinase YesM